MPYLTEDTPNRPRACSAAARTADALPHASPEIADMWATTQAVIATVPAPIGLAAGERPGADVEVLASTAAAAEYELARRMHRADTGGALALPGRGAVLAARGWSTTTARRLARCAALADAHPSLAAVWAAGVIGSEHVDPIARRAEKFTADELTAVIAELDPHWGSWSPAWIEKFVHAAHRRLHPPPDPDDDETRAHAARYLSFSITQDQVLLAGALPRIEGEQVIAAIDALADRLRSTADPVPAAARRADALVGLVDAATTAGTLPTRNGLPVALSVTLDHTTLGDPVWTTSRGHHLTPSEARWVGCTAEITPIATTRPGCPDPHLEATIDADVSAEPTPAARIAALAALMFDTRIPLAVGRTHRTATPAQRRALAVRDRGCIIPGCGIPAEACQTHHLKDWAHGGNTDLPHLVLLCWAHHRQVDLHMWTIQPGRPAGPIPNPGAPPGTPWPANHGAPFTITRTPRHAWRT